MLLSGSCDLIRTIPEATVDLLASDMRASVVNEDHFATELARVIKATGTVFLMLSDANAARHKIALENAGFTMRNWLVWHWATDGFSVEKERKFATSHAHILYMVKNAKEFTFNVDPIKVPSARQTAYKDKRAKSGGKVPDDTWSIATQAHCGESPERLARRLIYTASNPDDMVCDPCAATGALLVAAKELQRQFLGISPERSYDAVNLQLNRALIV